MFKKIAMAALLVATSSFATWDYYAIPDAGKGTIKAQFLYDTDDPWSQWGLNVSGRYVIMQGLELSLQSFGYLSQESGDWDGSGFTDFILGGRYAVMPNLNVFLDMNIPIGDDEVSSNRFSFYLGGQFSQELVPSLLLGTEVGAFWGFEHHDSEPGLILEAAGELGYAIPNIGLTPFIGLQLKYKLTDDEYNDHDADDTSGDTQFNLWVGVTYAINAEMAVDGKLIMRSGDNSLDMDGDATGVRVDFYFNF
jgi:hypothetical protein